LGQSIITLSVITLSVIIPIIINLLVLTSDFTVSRLWLTEMVSHEKLILSEELATKVNAYYSLPISIQISLFTDIELDTHNV
jgi:hypothetical protein